ncbi:MAG: hypothetical protein HC926_02320 [Synechococcaceae cyanobacterium SM2_3_60]|nr:hypothetical protein [Synechococcaceae cyanobacterium SM2_3_60]
MRLTWFDANTWLLQWQSLSVLVDPWLVGDLIFGGAPWFFRGSRSRSWPIPESIDLILLSQGLPDHSHIPTLRQLDRQIPVIASPSAARVAEGLGFTQVTQLTHNQQIVFHELEITALPGAPLGPLVQENAYILRSAGQVLYYEPHGYPDSSLANYAPLDVAITPVETLKLPRLAVTFTEDMPNRSDYCDHHPSKTSSTHRRYRQCCLWRAAGRADSHRGRYRSRAAAVPQLAYNPTQPHTRCCLRFIVECSINETLLFLVCLVSLPSGEGLGRGEAVLITRGLTII